MKKKSILQKVSIFFGITSFTGAFVSLIWLLLTKEGASQEYVASMAALSFVCFAGGVVFMTMGTANLPNLTPGE
ncbi:hypothetical protein [Thalassomonas sp. RHCl1]|uniref:hypothetical protein n=1 Tax=Thalassomonas sp. RHCl1 TaxID=2995320 RepID=UPI00248C80C6|nr:hypothetical protein [Thalassomonas sp. RHCl1]